MKNNNNLHVSSAYGFSFFLALPAISLLLMMLFDSRIDFDPSVVYLFLPSFIYLLYAHFFIRNYYKRKLEKRIMALEKINISVDEMVSKNVENKNFNFLGLGANVGEYFFIIYNKEYDKNFKISSVRHKPDYADIYIPEWEGKKMSIYIDPKELEDSEDTLRVFRFSLGTYNLEDNYAYSISEDIARKGLFEGLFLLYPMLFVCVYLFIVGIEL